MDFFDVINARRSVRKYTPERVGDKVLETIVAAGIEAPTGCNMQAKQYVIVNDPQVMAKISPLTGAMDGASAAIVLLIEPKGTKFGEFWMQDASAAMENMLLAAVAAGYAGCWIEGAVRPHEDQLREILAVPDHLRVWSLTPIGRPAALPQRPPKPDLADITHRNGFGWRW